MINWLYGDGIRQWKRLFARLREPRVMSRDLGERIEEAVGLFCELIAAAAGFALFLFIIKVFLF